MQQKITTPSSKGDGQHSAAQNLSDYAKLERAREPINRSFGLIRGKFPSRKMGRMIHWESMNELNAVRMFEYSPGVVAYREQPL